jgi:hypothetical protein
MALPVVSPSVLGCVQCLRNLRAEVTGSRLLQVQSGLTSATEKRDGSPDKAAGPTRLELHLQQVHRVYG